VRRVGAIGVLAAILVSACALLVVELGLGGWRYGAAPLHDPCKPRLVLEGGGGDRAAQRLAITILDRLACREHKSREEYVLGLADRADDLVRLIERVEDLLKRFPGDIDEILDLLGLLD
jgi:hypothetical protein